MLEKNRNEIIFNTNMVDDFCGGLLFLKEEINFHEKILIMQLLHFFGLRIIQLFTEGVIFRQSNANCYIMKCLRKCWAKKWKK